MTSKAGKVCIKIQQLQNYLKLGEKKRRKRKKSVFSYTSIKNAFLTYNTRNGFEKCFTYKVEILLINNLVVN